MSDYITPNDLEVFELRVRKLIRKYSYLVAGIREALHFGEGEALGDDFRLRSICEILEGTLKSAGEGV